MVGSTSRPYSFTRSRVRASALALSKKILPFRGSRLMTMFWATVKEGTSMKCWWTMPTPMLMEVLGS